MHSTNSFVTLTYRPESIPSDMGLHVDHFQRFAKRLRKQMSFRYFMCGEYGETNKRPHFHALIFGQDFHADRQELRGTRKYPQYTSKLLETAWGYGYVQIGALTFESAAYVARYVMKKVTGTSAEAHYTRYNSDTGECWSVRPEFITMSRRPGIGSNWFDKFHKDVYPSDEVVHNGKRFRPPRYYDSKLPEPTLEELKERRSRMVGKMRDHLTPDKLRVRETIAAARLSRLHRNL